MQDFIGAILLFVAVVGVLVITVRYAYLAWFQPEKFRRTVRGTWSGWQRNMLGFRIIQEWIDSPNYILAARVTTIAALLCCGFILILIVRPIVLTIIHAFGG